MLALSDYFGRDKATEGNRKITKCFLIESLATNRRSIDQMSNM